MQGISRFVRIARRRASKEFRKRFRRICARIGVEYYAFPALHDIDKKLLNYVPPRDGFFVEVGANDGYRQSNTYYLEKFRNWRGILIEGIPELYEQCTDERRASHVFNCALVSEDYDSDEVTMNYANLMSVVEGAFGSKKSTKSHVDRGLNIQDIKMTYEVTVPARTLTSILDEVQPAKIDLFSLDVEGYELEVLDGLDFDRYRPSFLLVEARDKDKLLAAVPDAYELVDEFSHHDILLKLGDDSE